MGLVQYDSSDDDEDVTTETTLEIRNPSVETSTPNVQNTNDHPSTTKLPQPPSAPPELGPILGPSRPPPEQQPSFEQAPLQAEDVEDQEAPVDLSFLDPPSANMNNASSPSTSTQQPPPSPYTATRTLLRDLTLPAVANMDIPPSPPGSPPRGHEALTAKFDTFLRLKRTKGVHFNERLASSAVLRNPALMDKLLGFVGLETGFGTDGNDDEDGGGDGDGNGDGGGVGSSAAGIEQYATVLPMDVWDPYAFPRWAVRGSLRRAQEQLRKERERGKGEAVEFVSAGSINGGGDGRGVEVESGSKAGTPAGGGAGRRKG